MKLTDHQYGFFRVPETPGILYPRSKPFLKFHLLPVGMDDDATLVIAYASEFSAAWSDSSTYATVIGVRRP